MTEQNIYRIAVLIFVAALVGMTQNPYYIWGLLLLMFFRTKGVKRTILGEFDAIHDRLDEIERKNREEREKTLDANK